MNTFTGHRRWGSVIAWGLNISFIQDETANTRLYYTKIVANLAPFLCSIICVFGENLKHVIQIPCKDWGNEVTWANVREAACPPPFLYLLDWPWNSEIRATFLSTGRKVTTYLPWTERFSPSESQRGSLSKWDWQNSFSLRFSVRFSLTESQNTELQTLQESKQVLHWDLRHGWECLGRQVRRALQTSFEEIHF